MLTLTIDGRSISVALGATMRDAARAIDLDGSTMHWADAADRGIVEREQVVAADASRRDRMPLVAAAD